jgi:hypothetical protein
MAKASPALDQGCMLEGQDIYSQTNCSGSCGVAVLVWA